MQIVKYCDPAAGTAGGWLEIDVDLPGYVDLIPAGWVPCYTAGTSSFESWKLWLVIAAFVLVWRLLGSSDRR